MIASDPPLTLSLPEPQLGVVVSVEVDSLRTDTHLLSAQLRTLLLFSND